MGREYRLRRDPRVREASDRRIARIPAAVQAAPRKLSLDRTTVVAGIDVGEDFLDVAVVAPCRKLLLARVGLRGISGEPLATLARRIGDAISVASHDIVALVDSPRWPRDLDCSSVETMQRPMVGASRNLDRRLRAAVKIIARSPDSRFGQFAMFPTPPLDYFARCVSGDFGKPHLRAFADALFGTALDDRMSHGGRVGGGAIFTRFMLSGFAAYRALESLGVRAYECYPDLQFRLWARGSLLPSKRDHKLALTVRRRILMRLARRSGVEIGTPIRTMDQADAAILSLGAVAARETGGLFVFEEPAEGGFLLAADKRDAEVLSLSRQVIL